MAERKHVYQVEVFSGSAGCVFSGIAEELPEVYGAGYRYNDLRSGGEVVVSGTVIIARIEERRKTIRR